MTLFYSSISILCAAVVGLLVGFVAGYLVLGRYLGGFDRALERSPRLANATATIWGYNEVDKRIRGGATLDEIGKFIDEDTDRLVEAIKTKDVGRSIWEATRNERGNPRAPRTKERGRPDPPDAHE